MLRVSFSLKLSIGLLLTLGSFGEVSGQEKSESPLWCEYESAGGPGKGKHVVLIAGDDEYRSEEALPMLGKILARRHGFKCTVLFPVNEKGIVQPNFQKNIPGMEILEDADCIILGLRFRNLPDDQMKHFDNYLKTGKPILAIRTSTHAFRMPADSTYAKYSFNSRKDGWIGGFGQQVLGDTWVNHHGAHGSESTRGIIRKENASHPILKGVTDVWGPTDVYTIAHLPESANVLLDGQVIAGMQPSDKAVDNKKNNPMMPVAWTKVHHFDNGKNARVFCTTMGAATDFESEGMRRLLVNATYWSLQMESQIDPNSDVSFVDPYDPTDFGFGSFKKNRRPEFYDLQNK